MADSQKMKITRRAYELWQQAGEPKDRDEEFYLQAERELNEAPENAITDNNLAGAVSRTSLTLLCC